ncbi:hypothetical protein IC582_010521 [Cucumis melo]
MLNRTKERTMRMPKSNSKPAWVKLLAQCSQIDQDFSHELSFGLPFPLSHFPHRFSVVGVQKHQR